MRLDDLVLVVGDRDQVAVRAAARQRFEHRPHRVARRPVVDAEAGPSVTAGRTSRSGSGRRPGRSPGSCRRSRERTPHRGSRSRADLPRARCSRSTSRSRVANGAGGSWPYIHVGMPIDSSCRPAVSGPALADRERPVEPVGVGVLETGGRSRRVAAPGSGARRSSASSRFVGEPRAEVGRLHRARSATRQHQPNRRG